MLCSARILRSTLAKDGSYARRSQSCPIAQEKSLCMRNRGMKVRSLLGQPIKCGRMFRSGDGDSKPLWVGATPTDRAIFTTYSSTAEHPADNRKIRVPFLVGGLTADGEIESLLAYIQSFSVRLRICRPSAAVSHCKTVARLVWHNNE